MGKNIHLLSQLVLFLIWLIELVVAAKVNRNKDAPIIIQKFFWYPLVGVVIGCFLILQFLNIIAGIISFVANTTSLLFHFSFLSYFIYRATNKTKAFKIISSVIFTITIVLIASDIITNYSTSFAFANSGLFLFSLYYFFVILKQKKKINLSGNAIFLVCCGIFIGSGLIVPSTLMIKYMYEQKIQVNSLFLASSISQVGYIIMNLFFIKALLCSRQTKNISD